jgi:hypothetical protein
VAKAAVELNVESILLDQDIEVFDAVEITVKLTSTGGEPVSASHPRVLDLEERVSAGPHIRERFEDLLAPSNSHPWLQSVAKPIRGSPVSAHGIGDQTQRGLAVVSVIEQVNDGALNSSTPR